MRKEETRREERRQRTLISLRPHCSKLTSYESDGATPQHFIWLLCRHLTSLLSCDPRRPLVELL